MMYVGCYLSRLLKKECLNLIVDLGNRTGENPTCGSETERFGRGNLFE